MQEITVTGMVISSMPIGEYDRRLEILTSEIGRISAFARGARKPSSSLVACSRVFAFGKFTLFQGRSSYSLNSAEINDYFEELSFDFEMNCLGSYFLETARYFSRENLRAEEMLRLLYISLKALRKKNPEHRLVKAIYELKLLDINGILKKPDKKTLSEPCAYAVDHVINNPPGKIYTFKLSPEVLCEFEKTADRLFERAVDVKFKSLEMMNDL